MDIQIEIEDHEIDFTENKIGLPDSEIIEELNKQGFKKSHPIRKVIGIRID